MQRRTPQKRSIRPSAVDLHRSGKRQLALYLAAIIGLCAIVVIAVVGGIHVNEHVFNNQFPTISDTTLSTKTNSGTTTNTDTINYTELNNGYTKLTKDGGAYYNPETGLKETYYSQNVLPGGGLDIPGRYVDNDGLIRDASGYIACASSDYEKGSIIFTSLGTARVYDTGCPNGVVDIYTNW